MHSLLLEHRLLLTAIAVTVYALGGVIAWKQGVLMMIAAVLGGYIGARLARRLNKDLLRKGIVAIGIIMTVGFFIK